jgi:hypothetical protein
MKKKLVKPKQELVIEEIRHFQEIAEVQLERLRAISRDRLLTFEETKIFDLLTKNLLLSEKASGDIEGQSEKVEAVSTTELIQIAQAAQEFFEVKNEVKEDLDVKKTPSN